MRSIRAEDYQDVPRRVAVMPKTYAAGSRTGRHFHPRAQLLYATVGLMMATAEDGTWVVPEGHALWIPPRLPHAVVMHGTVSMCSAYLAAEAVSGFPARAQVIEVSPLLAAALAALTGEPVLYDEDGRGGHLAALVLDEIERAPETRLTLPLPNDPRLRRVCIALIDSPSATFDLDAWAEHAGVSRRTLTRGFRDETGLSSDNGAPVLGWSGPWRSEPTDIRCARSQRRSATEVFKRCARAWRASSRLLQTPKRRTHPSPVDAGRACSCRIGQGGLRSTGRRAQCLPAEATAAMKAATAAIDTDTAPIDAPAAVDPAAIGPPAVDGPASVAVAAAAIVAAVVRPASAIGAPVEADAAAARRLGRPDADPPLFE